MRQAQVPFGVVGMAALLTVSLTASIVAQSPSPVPSALPSAPVATPGAAVPLGPITWKRVTKGKAFTSNPAAYAVGQLPDGCLVVLGSVGDRNGQPTGAGWVSADGSKWARLKLKAPKGSAIATMGTLGATIVLGGTAGIGSVDAEGLVWTSTDGTTWSPATRIGGQLYGLVTTPSGLVGVGLMGGGATAWTTTDAITWTPVPLAPVGRALHVMMGPDGTLAAAGVVGGMEGDSTPAVWSSTDGGATWTQTILPGLAEGFWSAPAGALTPIGLVATFSEPGQGGAVGRVWTSPDGLTWTESLVDEDGSLLAAGSVGTDALVIGHGQVLRSSDGVTWTPTDEASFADWQVRDVMTLADGRLLAAGDAFLSQTESAIATWTGTAEPLPQ